jgi:hypothetical protein
VGLIGAIIWHFRGFSIGLLGGFLRVHPVGLIGAIIWHFRGFSIGLLGAFFKAALWGL